MWWCLLPAAVSTYRQLLEKDQSWVEAVVDEGVKALRQGG